MLSQLQGFSVSLQVSVVTVVFIHTMEDDQRLNALVYEGDTLYYRIARRQKIPVASQAAPRDLSHD